MSQANETEIYKAIKEAIIQQKLRPNMQLVEDVIAESFGVSRTPVRNVLRRLAIEKLVTVIPYKGTFVSCPTVEEAKEVFEMRRVLEAAAIRKVCHRLTEEQFRQLELVLEEEEEFHRQGDWFGALRITGDFHLKIAEMAGNFYFYRYLEELVSLTYVIIAFYGKRHSIFCQDHKRILHAMRLGDEHLSERLMTDHLKEIEAELDFGEAGAAPASLNDIFRPKKVST
ncbi:GntR family transcriptional regulator [Paenibacillus sp.]|uniref:GntR family transcriptional regulator n=1 Tax=Paenibacillus sp. TaxID=58172 RepID=UPI002D591C58|nr:GntR family transcriptional regulator [Paenibacillus sp.]HZG85810.1 GntR family transcriptional regulator [Paenibacillus sp.]